MKGSNMTKPKYRLLRKGETTKDGDELFYTGDKIGWAKMSITGNVVYDAPYFKYRRRIRKGEK